MKALSRVFIKNERKTSNRWRTLFSRLIARPRFTRNFTDRQSRSGFSTRACSLYADRSAGSRVYSRPVGIAGIFFTERHEEKARLETGVVFSEILQRSVALEKVFCLVSHSRHMLELRRASLLPCSWLAKPETPQES